LSARIVKYLEFKDENINFTQNKITIIIKFGFKGIFFDHMYVSQDLISFRFFKS